MAISADGVDALHRLKSTDPPVYLSSSPDLSKAARLASQQLFSSLKPFTPKSPIDRLLVDGFDAEQIWQQIDLQTQPLISTLRREVKKLEKNPEEILKLFGEADAGKPEKVGKAKAKAVEKIDNGVEDEDNDLELDLEDFNVDEDDEEESENEGEEDEEDREKEPGDHVGVEDKFLKINELEEYLEDDEAREYGTTKKKTVKRVENEDEKDDEEDDEEDDEDDEFGLEEDEEEAEEDARYEDFFGDKKKDKKGTPYGARKESDKKTDMKRRPKWIQEVNDLDVADEKDDEMTDKKRKSKLIEESDGSDSGDEEDDEMDADNQKNEPLSTHEKNLQKQRSKIEEMEKANMEPKTWTMQGEITAAKRPKDSALEVVLDYQRNVKAAPVITEEVTESLEDLIQKRISEGNFDDIHRAPSLPSKAPREVKELDENKSKKGLGEIYADEYVQKTGLVSAALSFSDEQKKESSVLLKRLCLKLDALSHFHFTPKPVIEDMSIQVNVPALAMEEIAPLAVSDAAMLAPEEVFSGKGDIKEEAELTQAERKRRRANKKRKFKATTVNKMAAKKARESKLPNVDGQES